MKKKYDKLLGCWKDYYLEFYGVEDMDLESW